MSDNILQFRLNFTAITPFKRSQIEGVKVKNKRMLMKISKIAMKRHVIN